MDFYHKKNWFIFDLINYSIKALNRVGYRFVIEIKNVSVIPKLKEE
jgi:hypothetical protein